MSLQYLQGARAIDVMLLHPCGSFHGDQNYPKVLLFVQSFGMDTRGPGLLLFRIGDLTHQIKLCEIGSHVAVIA
jgi:hypothetical protein